MIDHASAHVAVAGLTKRFGAATVLDRIDLEVARGALVTLLGPSGCGKTTLLRLIAGLATPDEGRVSIAGTDVTRTPPHKRNVGVVFQSYALFPHLDVGGNVGFGLSGKGLAKEAIAAKVARALDLVQMGRFKDRPVTALSGGQQQRVALARALAVEPNVLLFDEALSALDRTLRETMQVELRRLLEGSRRHRRLRHPRSGRGAHHVRPDRGDERRPHRAIRRSARRLCRAQNPVHDALRRHLLGIAGQGGRARKRRNSRRNRGRRRRRARRSTRRRRTSIVATRPEHVRIGGEAGANDNQTEGQIRQITFQGSRTRLVVDVAGADFIVEIGGVGELPVLGQSVPLRWPVARSFAFTDPKAAA